MVVVHVGDGGGGGEGNAVMGRSGCVLLGGAREKGGIPDTWTDRSELSTCMYVL